MIICEDINVTIGGASASTYSSISWSTTGTGTFANGNTVSPTYTPSAADILSGSVTLTLTANAISPCGGTVADQAILTISRIPVVNAGADDLVCSTDSYVIADASSIDHDSVTWISSGTGTFGNPNSVATTYTPSAADIANGSVILTLTAYNMPCASVSDSKLLTIVMAPSVNAGPGATICSSCTYSITGASAPNSGSVLWTTYGSGSFSNPSILNPVYQPSAFDISQGYVILQLTANGNAPCDAVMDTMTLFISANPGIDFTWGPSCEGQPVPFQVNAALTNIGAIANWNWDFGDGSGSAMMNPSHLFPATGHYMVTLTATDTLGNLITNHHPVYVSEPPVAFFAYDSPVCSNQSVQFTDLSHTLFGNISEWIWMHCLCYPIRRYHTGTCCQLHLYEHLQRTEHTI
jgi:PKD repeat protein